MSVIITVDFELGLVSLYFVQLVSAYALFAELVLCNCELICKIVLNFWINLLLLNISKQEGSEKGKAYHEAKY